MLIIFIIKIVSCRQPVATEKMDYVDGIKVVRLNELEFRCNTSIDKNGEGKIIPINDIITKDMIDAIYIIQNATSAPDKVHVIGILSYINHKKTSIAILSPNHWLCGQDHSGIHLHAIIVTKSKKQIHYFSTRNGKLIKFNNMFGEMI